MPHRYNYIHSKKIQWCDDPIGVMYIIHLIISKCKNIFTDQRNHEREPNLMDDIGYNIGMDDPQ